MWWAVGDCPPFVVAFCNCLKSQDGDNSAPDPGTGDGVGVPWPFS